MSVSGRKRKVAAGAAIGIGTAAAMASSAHGADLAVNSVSGGDDQEGSFLWALSTANQTPATNDRIVFQSGLSGQLTVPGTLTSIGPVQIVGSGANLVTISGDDNYQIFRTHADTTISGLTLAHGSSDSSDYPGGAIGSYGGDLTLDSVHIDDNQAILGGGVAAVGATLTVKNSTVDGNTAVNGGGIFDKGGAVVISNSKVTGNKAAGSFPVFYDGPSDLGGGAYISTISSKATITGSEFSGNQADQGGGLAVATAASVDSSLISGNSARSSAGMLIGSTLPGVQDSIVNSTITGNVAVQYGAGVTAAGSGMSVSSSTISGNTNTNPTPPPFGGTGLAQVAGLLQFGGSAELTNTIASGNTPGDLGTSQPVIVPIVLPGGTMNGSFNLIGDKSNAKFTETVPGSNISSTDPQLGPLADNGGPTKTMLPADGSPVVNKGSSPLTVDQRGLVRPVDFNSIPFSTAAGANGADIGAVELQGGPLPKPPASNNFSFGKVKLNKKKGIATLQVKVPGAGKVILLGSRVLKPQKKSAKAKQTISLAIKPRGPAAKALRKKGKAKLRATVKFTPSGGKARMKSKTVKLIRKKSKKKKR